MKETVNELVVMLLAEGNVRVRKKEVAIVFTNKCEELRSKFREIAEELGQEVHKKGKKQLVIYSKDLGRQLLELSRSFRTKPCASGKQNACPVTKRKIKLGPSCNICEPLISDGKKFPPTTFPKTILNANPDNIAKYLRIFCSCEGGVVIGKDKRNDEVIIRVTHPKLREQIIEMFEKVGIKVKIRGKSLIYIKKLSEIRKFKEKIGFLEGCKAMRGKNVEIEKNRLLKLILERHSSCKQDRE
ncbi:MAG: LAGLIDADG family homing endonuclease [Candidatus Aenigmatarchaeota archaeon]